MIGPIDRFGFPGITLTTVLGKSRWNWPRATCPGVRSATDCSLGRPNWLATAPAPEPVGVGRDVEHFREARVRDRAVVALEEVLDADLPVARVLLPLRPRVKAQRVDVDTVVGEVLGKLAELVCERRRLRIRVDEHERPARVDRDTGRGRGLTSNPARDPHAARFATSRPGRTSTRGTGTGSSRAAQSPSQRTCPR